MKDVLFLAYHDGSKAARYFLDLEAWAGGETRRLADEVAQHLMDTWPGCFRVIEPKTPPQTPAQPGKDS